MTFSLGEYQDIFLEEADDQLQELNKNLLELENNSDDEDTINNIFRAAHSLKSSAAFVGLNDLSDLAHKMENLLQGIRDKTMVITPEIIEVLFKSFDFISEVINAVSQGIKPDQDLTDIIEDIKEISQSASANAAEKTVDKKQNEKSSEVRVPKTLLKGDDVKSIKANEEFGKKSYEVTIFIVNDAPMKWVKAQLILNNIKSIGQVIKTFPAEENLTDDNIDGVFKIILSTSSNIESIRRSCDVDLVTSIEVAKISFENKDGKNILKISDRQKFKENEEIFESTDKVQKNEKEAKPVKNEVVENAKPNMDLEEENDEKNDEKKKSIDKKSLSLKSVKVSVEKLDQLLNTVGELVIANSGFFRLYEEIRKSEFDKGISNEFKNRMEQMGRIAKDLQSGIMKTRMVPIGQVFSRFNRLVRDLAKTSDKNIQLITKGEDTELDKKVIDVINEPLMHLVRNSVDHGIESKEERARLKKDEVGTVTLNAYQGGNQIYVEVTDDGKGLDIDSIKRKALDRGLATLEQLANMDDQDIYQFIFHPGFSTAEKITDISGRGVGMNVVKEVANEMNGSVAIESEVGMGTVFTMSFPLTLAIIPAIMVKVQKETYAVPLSDVIETIKVSDQDITTIEGHEVINLRGEILSLLRLNRFIGIQSGLIENSKIPVVVVGYGNRKIGVIVDELEGKLEIVIKSLEQNYMSVEGLAGASILGDGSICLILDISSMIMKVISEQDKIAKEGRYRLTEKYKELSETIPEVGASSEKVETIAKAKSYNKIEELDKKENIIEKTGEKKTEITEGTEGKSKSEEITVAENKLEFGFKDREDVVKNAEDEIREASLEKQIPVSQGLYVKEEAKEEVVEDISITEEVLEKDENTEESEETFEEDVLFDKQTQPVTEVINENKNDVDEEVKKALQNFKEELESNISGVLGGNDADSHMKKSLNITEDELKRVQMLANSGITNAATSLSQIIGKRVDLSIPEVRLMPVENIPSAIGGIDDVYLGVYMPIGGDIKGTILFSLPEESGFNMINELYGLPSDDSRELTEDGSSALKEITNIVGSSVINSFADKTNLAILPLVPTIVHDYMQSIIDSILVMHNIANDYAIIMDTEFYYEDDRIMANLLILPETESIKYLVKHLG